MQGEVVITEKLKDVIEDDKNTNSNINVYSVPIYKDNEVKGVIFATHSTKLYEKYFLYLHLMEKDILI